MSALVPTESELKSFKIIAQVAASNQHWRKLGGNGSEESVVATILSVMLLARELSISPMQAISGGINNIQGKFEISARLMNQLIRKRGHKLQIKMLTNQMCKIWGKRNDTGEEMEVEYLLEEAMRSGLIKEGGAWKKVPQDMLFARAISRLARRLYPDCIGGCYVEGELQETILKDSVETIEVPSVHEVNCEPDKPVVLALPMNVDALLFETFLKESAKQNNVDLEVMRKRAQNNMDGCLQVFNSWREKQVAQQEMVEELAVN